MTLYFSNDIIALISKQLLLIGCYLDKKRGMAMQISSRFTIAVHIFDCIETFQGKYKLTSYGTVRAWQSPLFI